MDLFLIGAGFNIDAGSHTLSNGQECRYPLINDVARICFDMEVSQIPCGKSIEDLFGEAQANGESRPMKRLTEILMDADHYLAGALAGPTQTNCYSEFFGRFAGAHFLTFNYDSLIEIMLFQKKHWFPDDGYGVPVQTELQFDDSLPYDRKSKSTILHLHGSLCLCFSEFETQRDPSDGVVWLDPSAPTRFMFDPDCLTNDFSPYARFRPGLQYLPTDSRVIGPVPNKGPLLIQGFTRAIYEAAHGLISQSKNLVSIGYSFNHHDKASYEPILKVLAESRNGRLILVSPDATETAQRIVAEFPDLHVVAISKTFKEWSTTCFRYSDG